MTTPMTNDNELRALPAEWRAYANAERSTKGGTRRAADAYDACANELEAAFDAALAAAPAGGEVDEAMVERALSAFCNFKPVYSDDSHAMMRAALTAALHTPTERT